MCSLRLNALLPRVSPQRYIGVTSYHTLIGDMQWGNYAGLGVILLNNQIVLKVYKTEISTVSKLLHHISIG